MAEELNILTDDTDYITGVNNSNSEGFVNATDDSDNDMEPNIVEDNSDFFSAEGVLLVDDNENYSEAFSEDSFSDKIEDDDDIDSILEQSISTPPRVTEVLNKITGEWEEVILDTPDSIEEIEAEAKKIKGFDRWEDAMGELVDFGESDEEILNNGKEMEAELLKTFSQTNMVRDPIVIAMAKLAGSSKTGAKLFQKVINGIQLGMAGSQDILEMGLTQLQEYSPATFDVIDRAVNLGNAAEAETPSNLTDDISKSFGATAEFIETSGAFGFPQLLIRAASWSRMKRTTKKAIKNKDKIANAQKEFLKTARRNDVNSIRHRNAEADELIQTQADNIAKIEIEIVDELLVAMEVRVGRSLSKVDKDGVRSIDMKKVKEAGLEVTDELDRFDLKADGGDKSMVDTLFADGSRDSDSFVMPVLKPEKFNRLVAVIADIRKNHPEKFPKRNKDGSKRNLLDNLFDLALKPDANSPSILESELGDVLIKYGLSYEDYMLAAIGSGSEAGKILNKLSQMIKASSPESLARAKRTKNAKEISRNLRKGFIRLESIRRGGLVSQFATAARNLSSGVIRAPLEMLASVMDTTLLKFAEAPDYATGVRAAIDVTNPLTKKGAENWSDSFSMFKYMFKDMETAKNFSELLLEQPEFKVMFDKMFETLNEIQKASGRGKGYDVFGKPVKGASTTTKIFDKIFSEAEDVVQALNIPNRWQEMLMRRGAFFSEMQRLVRREWDIDLMDTLQGQGNMRKLIGDSSEFKPKGKLSFAEMMEQSTRKALDLTYAKEPETAVFRAASRFIVNSGLTVVIPFPRFMFSTMELMGNYAGGASIPLTRFIARNVSDVGKTRNLNKLTPKEFKKKYGMTKKAYNDQGKKSGTYGSEGVFADKVTGQMDRQRAIRNIQGVSVALAAYMYRSADDSPANAYEMYIGDDAVVDVSAQWPMRQYLWVGDQIAKIMDGTYGQQDWKQWYAEASKTFLGANFRTGQGSMLLEEIQEIVMGSETDLSSGENFARVSGKAIGNWLGSWAVPAAQLIDAQRVIGQREVKFKDHSKEPTLDASDTFFNEIKKPWLRFGDPAAEKQLPDSSYIFSNEKKRISPISKIAFGLNMYSRDEPWAEYVKKLGIKEWIIDSESKVPSVKRVENRLIEEHFPSVVKVAKFNEEYLRETYRNSNQEARDLETEESYVVRNNRSFIEKSISKIKQQVKDGRFSETSPLVRAQVNYRKMTSAQKEEAHFLFVQNTLDQDGKGIMPDPNNVEDLQKLKFIGDLIKNKYD